ncbi:8135_t:CDS:2, partial [Ambispora gerdemannii]
DIFHHDVKSANILIDKDLNVKLSNFDLARFSDELTTSLSGQMKSIRWTAPEKLNATYVAYSREMDVYSFAIVMWEIAARKEPFYQISDNIEVSEKIKKGDRPSPNPNDIMPEYQRIMELGWAQSFRFRPTMQQIIHELHMLYKPVKTKYEKIKQIKSEKSYTLPPWKDVTTAINKKNYEEAIEGLELYVKSDTKEAYLARYYAGKLLYEGHDSVPPDEFQAMVYLREAADHLPASNFTPLAQYLYAHICLNGTHYDQDNGIRYLRMAVRASEKNALFLYGNILFNGEHGEQIN